MVSQIDYPTRNTITRHQIISADPLSKTPSNPNSGQSGAVHTQSHFPKEATPVSSANERFHRGKSVYSRTILRNFLQSYLYVPRTRYHLYALSPARLNPPSTQYGVCTMPPPSETTPIPEPEVQATRQSITQLCPNKLNEAFLNYRTPWSPIRIINQ